MSLEVDVGTDGLGDLSRALTKKRLDYVKLSNALNEPPRGLSDLMAQSRAFTEKLTHFLEDGSELSDAVKNELVDDNGFPGHVRRLPLEDVYSDLERVKEELRVADGYQPYIVAPEAGLRDLFQRSIGSLVNPVRDLVDSVHGIVTMAADKALNESCQVPSIDRGPPVVRFPNFIESILPVTMEGLEDLKEEAMNVAVRIVEMEQSFVSCSFFRYLTFKRIHEQEEAQRERDLGRRPRRSNDDDDADDDDASSIAETEERSISMKAREDYVDILDVGHGLGSAVFWDPICRDQNNGLMPSPGIFIDGDTDLSMEKALMQHAADMKAYTRLACDTLIMTVPKVIVHCLVDKATEKLGPKIEEHILGLPTDARDMLLEEDGGIAGHRRRVQDAINEIGKAQDKLKETERNMGASTTAMVAVSIIELAGLSGRVKKRDDDTYVFINKPKPPANKRNVTPERRREPPTNPPPAPQPSPPQRPQRPPAQAVQRPAPSRTSNGVGLSQRTSPKREAPPVAVNSASGRPISPNVNPAGNGSNVQQNKPQPKQQGWYGFKPFGR